MTFRINKSERKFSLNSFLLLLQICKKCCLYNICICQTNLRSHKYDYITHENVFCNSVAKFIMYFVMISTFFL